MSNGLNGAVSGKLSREINFGDPRIDPVNGEQIEAPWPGRGHYSGVQHCRPDLTQTTTVDAPVRPKNIKLFKAERVY